MEGDKKEIVLARLEKRLSEKDREIQALKSSLAQEERAGVSALSKKVEDMELEIIELKSTVSELMKKLAAVESSVNCILVNYATGGECEIEVEAGPSLDAIKEPEESPIIEHIAAKGGALDFIGDVEKADKSEKEMNGKSSSSATRFFHLSDNS